jgi:SsrA-binding protein
MVISENKRVKFDYEILETLEAGIELLGAEVKSIKTGRINLAGSYVVIKNNQAWLINADIPPYQPKNTPADYDPKRARRLLLKRKEIEHLAGCFGKERGLPRSERAKRVLLRGLTLTPLKVYTKGKRQRIKIEIGLAKSRRKPDKRELIKKRDIEREIGRNL